MKYLSLIVTVLVFVVLIPIVQALGLEMPQTLIEKVGEPLVGPGPSFSLQAMVADPLGVVAVRCYFRYRRDADFVFVDMEQRENGMYQGFLPSPGSAVREMEYLFLAINERRQLVRTPVYKVKVRDREWIAGLAPGADKTIVVRTDLAVAPESDSLFVGSGGFAAAPVPPAERFGLAAGLYNNSENFDSAPEGYFGGFELLPSGKLAPVKGVMGLQEETRDSAVSAIPSLPPLSRSLASEITGPDIAGNTWEGHCYLGWGESIGQWYMMDITPITATVTHAGGQVSITLPSECIILGENIGKDFRGSINAAGNMLLDDQRNPVQTWSTHWGPATVSEIKIGDYVAPPDPENNPYPDYYVIELKRTYPPPQKYSFLSAVHQLLLPRKPQ